MWLIFDQDSNTFRNRHLPGLAPSEIYHDKGARQWLALNWRHPYQLKYELLNTITIIFNHATSSLYLLIIPSLIYRSIRNYQDATEIKMITWVYIPITMLPSILYTHITTMLIPETNDRPVEKYNKLIFICYMPYETKAKRKRASLFWGSSLFNSYRNRNLSSDFPAFNWSMFVNICLNYIWTNRITTKGKTWLSL